MKLRFGLYFIFSVICFFEIFVTLGCNSSKTADTTTTSGTFTDIYKSLLSTSCSGCHNPEGDVYKTSHVHLDFSTQATAYSTLTTLLVTGDTSKGICGNVKIVDPGSVSTSYLAGVLFSEYNVYNFDNYPNCKPYSAHLLDQHPSDSEKTSIISWINAGAPNN